MKYIIQLTHPVKDTFLPDLSYTADGVFVAENGNTKLFSKREADELSEQISGSVVKPWQPLKVSVALSSMSDKETLCHELETMAGMLRVMPDVDIKAGQLSVRLPNSIMIIRHEK